MLNYKSIYIMLEKRGHGICSINSSYNIIIATNLIKSSAAKDIVLSKMRIREDRF